VFKAPKLYLFSKGGILVAKQWPDLRAWWRPALRGGWRPLRPQVRVAGDVESGGSWISEGRLRRSSIVMGCTRIACALEAAHGQMAQPDESRSTERGGGGSEDRPDDPRVDGFVVHIDPDSWPQMEELPRGAVDGGEETGFDRNLRRTLAVSHERFATEAYFAAVPREVLQAVEPFAERQWHLMVLAARCPGALDLIRSNPALASVLASLWVYSGVRSGCHLRAARRLVRRPQREIAAAVGFPGTESAARTLRRIAPSACNVAYLLKLRSEWARCGNSLRHLRRINEAVLAAIYAGTPQVTLGIGFLEELVPLDVQEAAVGDLGRLRDLLWVLRRLPGHRVEVRNGAHLLKACEAALARLVGPKIAGRCVNVLVEDSKETPAPAPQPIPEKEPSEVPPLELVRLLSPEEIREEGSAQRNCVSRFAERVADSTLRFYRVTSPERATMAVAWPESGRPSLLGIATASNGSVRHSTLVSARRWVEAAARADLEDKPRP
jgi:hypothetical protein